MIETCRNCEHLMVLSESEKCGIHGYCVKYPGLSYCSSHKGGEDEGKGGSKEYDEVTEPVHYRVLDGVEAKDIIQAILNDAGLNPSISFRYGNILKYALRAPKKGTFLKDLRKIKQYIQMIEDEME